MSKFFGNCNNVINWDGVIKHLETQEPAYVGPRHKLSDPIPGIQQVGNGWLNAGYETIFYGGQIGWDMFQPGHQFDKSIMNKFAEFVGYKQVVECWISRIYPGYMAPWHWDTNDKDFEYEKMPPMTRFSCHISKPAPGHVFIIEDKCFYNQAQGNVYQWPDRQSWHAGANFGLTPKYLFNIFGYLK